MNVYSQHSRSPTATVKLSAYCVNSEYYSYMGKLFKWWCFFSLLFGAVDATNIETLYFSLFKIECALRYVLKADLNSLWLAVSVSQKTFFYMKLSMVVLLYFITLLKMCVVNRTIWYIVHLRIILFCLAQRHDSKYITK